MNQPSYGKPRWELLLRTFVIPQTELSQAAWNEMLTLVSGDKEALYEIIIERAGIDEPIGTLYDWSPARFRKRRR